MDFQYKSDNIRYNKIATALANVAEAQPVKWGEKELDAAEDLTLVQAYHAGSVVEVLYMELWNENCLASLFEKPEYKGLASTPLKAIQKFFKERFIKIASAANLEITDYDIYPTEYHGEAVLEVEMRAKSDESELDEIMTEADYATRAPAVAPSQQINPTQQIPRPIDKQTVNLPQGGQATTQVRPDNRFNQVYMTRAKTQDPKAVDMLLKTVFQEKFTEKYSLSTDIGDWHPVKTLKTAEGKLTVEWEHEKTTKIHIQTIFFPNETNKIQVLVTSSDGQMLIQTDFEIYRIPTDSFLVERFFRKVYFNIMKKFINTQVIKLEPFVRSFVFWKSTNPYFSYSFSEPRKNQIVLDLIGFIKTAQKPILDDFFEQNNLRHKQGYLQTLLDAAEDAGIFEFRRQGNEVLIYKGPNFKAFLEGRIRKV